MIGAGTRCTPLAVMCVRTQPWLSAIHSEPSGAAAHGPRNPSVSGSATFVATPPTRWASELSPPIHRSPDAPATTRGKSAHSSSAPVNGIVSTTDPSSRTRTRRWQSSSTTSVLSGAAAIRSIAQFDCPAGFRAE